MKTNEGSDRCVAWLVSLFTSIDVRKAYSLRAQLRVFLLASAESKHKSA